MQDQHHPGKCHPTAGQPEWVPWRACALPSGVVGALYLVSLSSMFLFLPHLPSLGDVKMYPLLSSQRKALFLAHLPPLYRLVICHHLLGPIFPSTCFKSMWGKGGMQGLQQKLQMQWQSRNSPCAVGGSEQRLGSRNAPVIRRSVPWSLTLLKPHTCQ